MYNSKLYYKFWVHFVPSYSFSTTCMDFISSSSFSFWHVLHICFCERHLVSTQNKISSFRTLYLSGDMELWNSYSKLLQVSVSTILAQILFKNFWKLDAPNLCCKSLQPALSARPSIAGEIVASKLTLKSPFCCVLRLRSHVGAEIALLNFLAWSYFDLFSYHGHR